MIIDQNLTSQLSTIFILLQLDKDGKGSISLYDYFGIFESHGIEVTPAESRRVIRLAGDDGMLTKENFFKIVQGSDFFLKSFDKNNDGEVTEVKWISRYLYLALKLIYIFIWFPDFLFQI